MYNHAKVASKSFENLSKDQTDDEIVLGIPLPRISIHSLALTFSDPMPFPMSCCLLVIVLAGVNQQHTRIQIT